MHSLRILWQQRSQREQRLLVAMALALFVGIAYYAFWQPWLDREQQWRQTLAKEQASLRWMQQQAPLLQQLSRQRPGPAPTTEEPAAVIMREATRQALAIVRLQPQGMRVNVTLEVCTFQALMSWLDALGRQGIHAASLAVTAHPQRPGWVTVNTLILERRHEK